MVMILLSNPHELFLSSSHCRNPVNIWPSSLTTEECKLLPTGLSLNLPRSVLRRMLSFSLETVCISMPLSNNFLMVLCLRNDPEYDHRGTTNWTQVYQRKVPVLDANGPDGSFGTVSSFGSRIASSYSNVCISVK